MAAAAPEPKADTRPAFNGNTDDEFPLKPIPRNHRRGNPISTAGPCNKEGNFMRAFLEWWSDMKDALIVMFILFVLCIMLVLKAAFDKLIPNSIKENFAAAFTKERVERCPTRWLAPLDSSPTNPGGVAESEPCLLLDSGASFHAVGDVSLLTGIELFLTDMWAACADGTRMRIVGTGTMHTDRFTIPKVHLVDGLQKNLISVSQLDKDHGLCCCFRSNKCEVILADGTVVGGAILLDNGTYELRFLEVPEA